MNKSEFLNALRAGLSGLPSEDIEKSIDFYSELIDEQIDDGVSEHEAVERAGSIDEIVKQILIDMPLPKLFKAKAHLKRPLNALEIILIILGTPVWLPILAALFIIVLAIFLVIWVVVAVLFTVDLVLGIVSCVALPASLVLFLTAHSAPGLFLLGSFIGGAGLTILLFIGCIYLTKAVVGLSKITIRAIKSCFIKRSDKSVG